MKYYGKLLAMGCFSLRELTHLTGNVETARSICKSYLKKEYIKRIKRDLYVAISIETGQPIANRFVIASHISDSAVVSHHSAFEYYGYANQVFYKVQVTSKNRFRDIYFDGFQYQRIMPQIYDGVIYENGVSVTSLERTVIDGINSFDMAGGLEELLRCIALIPTLNETKLLNYLAEYGNGFLYQKAGYILSHYASSLGLTDAFFAECKKHLPKGKSYLYTRTSDFIFHKDWQLYAPVNVFGFTDKGVIAYDAI